MALFIVNVCGNSLFADDASVSELVSSFDCRLGKPSVATSIAEELVRIGEKQDDPALMARGYARLAFLLARPGQDDPAFPESLEKAEQNKGPDHTLAAVEVDMYLGYIQARAFNKFQESTTVLNGVAERALELHDDRLLAMVYMLSADVLCHTDEKWRSRDHSARALRFAELSGDPRLSTTALFRLVSTLSSQGAFRAALPHANRLIEIGKQDGKQPLGAQRVLWKMNESDDYESILRAAIDGEKKPSPRWYLRLASLILVSHPDEAAELSKQALKKYESRKDFNGVLHSRLMLAACQLEGEDGKDVVARFSKILDTLSKQSIYNFVSDVDFELAGFFEFHNALDRALRSSSDEALRLAKLADDQTAGAVHAAEMFVNQEMELRQKRTELTEQRQQSAVDRADNDVMRQELSRTQWLVVALVGFGSLLSLVTWVTMLARHRNRLVTEVAAKTASLQQATDAAEAARDQAHSANMAKTEFLARVNHELRNPLNAILGYSQLLCAEGKDSNEQIRGLRSSSEHLLQLVNNVLDVSSIESAEIVIHNDVIDLHGVFDSVRDFLEQFINAQRVEFSVQVAEDVPKFVIGDESRLRQILINLATNAMKFTTDGSITIVAKRLAGTEDDSVVRISVTDTGCGIRADELTRIFEPYTQANNAVRDRSGNGLGLFICKSFIEKMDGTICVSSEPGSGSCFEFTINFPHGNPSGDSIVENMMVKIPQPAAAEITADFSGQSAHSKTDNEIPRVLVIDDLPENLNVLSKMLKVLGFSSKTAVNEGAAIALVGEWQPHVILMDLHMPGDDGFTIASRIRAMPQQSDAAAVIIAMTGDALFSVRETALSNGFDAFLPKPIAMKTLDQTIRRFSIAQDSLESAYLAD